MPRNETVTYIILYFIQYRIEVMRWLILSTVNLIWKRTALLSSHAQCFGLYKSYGGLSLISGSHETC